MFKYQCLGYRASRITICVGRQRFEIRKSCGLEIRDTADWKSALRDEEICLEIKVGMLSLSLFEL
jgi:hypothetical protein